MTEKQKTVSVTMNGEEIATFKTSRYKHSPEPIEGAGEMSNLGFQNATCATITDDDSEGWKALLPKEYAVEWHVGGNVYMGTISREEFQRMIADGVLK